MLGAMLRALDPYHRIRALVAALFLLTVMALALVSMHGPRHASVSSVSNVSTASAGAVQPAP